MGKYLGFTPLPPGDIGWLGSEIYAFGVLLLVCIAAVLLNQAVKTLQKYLKYIC